MLLRIADEVRYAIAHRKEWIKEEYVAQEADVDVIDSAQRSHRIQHQSQSQLMPCIELCFHFQQHIERAYKEQCIQIPELLYLPRRYQQVQIIYRFAGCIY